MESIECPRCGAPIRDLKKQNCEYCGSLFVRFVTNNVSMDSYVIDTPEGKKIESFIFPGLKEAFDEVIDRFQSSNYRFFLDVYSKSRPKIIPPQIIHPQVAGFSDNFGFVIHLTFNNEPDKQLKSFFDLPESKLFTRNDYQGIPCFTINYGVDPSGAAMLYSKLLIDVYGFSKNDEFKYKIYDDGLA